MRKLIPFIICLLFASTLYGAVLKITDAPDINATSQALGTDKLPLGRPSVSLPYSITLDGVKTYTNTGLSSLYATVSQGARADAAQPAATAINTSNIASQSVNYANSAGAASYLNSAGAYSSTSFGTTRGLYGVRLLEAYSGGYPVTYGNILHLYGNGASQLLLGWSATDGQSTNNYIRSKRNNDTGAWSPWAMLWTNTNLTNVSQLSNDAGYATTSGTVQTANNALALNGQSSSYYQPY